MYAIDAKVTIGVLTVLVVRRGVHLFVKVRASPLFDPDVLQGIRVSLRQRDVYGCVDVPGGALWRAVPTKRLVRFTRNRRLIPVHHQTRSSTSQEWIYRLTLEAGSIDPACVESVTLVFPKGEKQTFSNEAFIKPGE